MQFAQDSNDPVLSKLYGTVDAYFDSYNSLERMLQKQRELNGNTPLGMAEYNLDDPAPELLTMLGMGANYLDMYLFRGGSQFSLAAKGYGSSSYEVNAPLAEGGYALPQYGAVKAIATFLRQYGAVLARAKPADQPATVDDPELWVKQRNNGRQGFLFVRSDVRGVSERTLALKSLRAQHITYFDPVTGNARMIPQYTTMLLRRNQSRLMVLNLPVTDDAEVVYSTADLLGHYSAGGRSWLVFYGDPGQQGEVVFSLQSKPDNLPRDAIWDDHNHEAVLRLQFGRRDQTLDLGGHISLLVLTRERAYAAKELLLANHPALIVSNANETDAGVSLPQVNLQWGLRHSPGSVTVLSARKLRKVTVAGYSVPVRNVHGAQVFSANIPVSNMGLPAENVRFEERWKGGAWAITRTERALRSLPELGIYKKGITHYSAVLPAHPGAVRLRFFTDDYKAIYLNGKFLDEASNRAPETMVPSECNAGQNTCKLDIYYVDTGRPKEDLGNWRLDEKKGLDAAAWIEGASEVPFNSEWKIEFADLQQVKNRSGQSAAPTVTKYSFPRPHSAGWDAVWRLFMPQVRGLVYLNGVFVEDYQPGRVPDLGRPGIYLLPSSLNDNNQLLFVSCEPLPRDMELPVIRPDADSIRKITGVQLSFSARLD